MIRLTLSGKQQKHLRPVQTLRPFSAGERARFVLRSLISTHRCLPAATHCAKHREMELVLTAVSLLKLHTDTWSASEGQLHSPFSAARLASGTPASPAAVCKRRRLRHSFPSTHRVSPLGGPPRLGDDRLGASHFPLPLFALPAQGFSILASLSSGLLCSMTQSSCMPRSGNERLDASHFPLPPFAAA